MTSTLLHSQLSRGSQAKGIEQILGYYQTYHNYSLDGPEPQEFYDTEFGRKKSLQKNVQDSANRMSIMRSSVPRFKTKRASDVTPFGCYNVDTGDTASMEKTLKQNKRFYSATFGNAPRLAEVPQTAAPDIMYDVKRLKNARQCNLADEMENSPNKYSNLRSKYSRLVKPKPTDAPDIMYDVDYGNKSTLHSSMLNSPIAYSILSKSKTQRGKGTTTSDTTCSEDIGPGSYNSQLVKDMQVSVVNEQNRQTSCFASTSSRFYNDQMDPSKNLGSTWKQAHDDKSWAKNCFTIPKSRYLRPQYLPAIYADM